jgi:hypothetical protein
MVWPARLIGGTIILKLIGNLLVSVSDVQHRNPGIGMAHVLGKCASLLGAGM